MIGWGISRAPVAIGYRDQLLELMTHISSGRYCRQEDIASVGGQEIKTIKVILLIRTVSADYRSFHHSHLFCISKVLKFIFATINF